MRPHTAERVLDVFLYMWFVLLCCCCRLLSSLTAAGWTPVSGRADRSPRQRRYNCHDDRHGNGLRHLEMSSSNVPQSPQPGPADDNVLPPTQQSSSTPRRRYRPGFNSYLKVLLDETTVSTLHEATLELQQFVANLNQQDTTASSTSVRDDNDDQQRTAKMSDDPNSLQEPPSSGTVRRDDEPTGARASHKPLRIKPRSLQSLHCTLLFGGEVLGEIPADELVQWHARISQRLAQSGFSLASSTNTTAADDDSIRHDDNRPSHPDEDDNFSSNNKNDSDQHHDDADDDDHDQVDAYWIRLDRLVTFPPRRHNLVVALLRVSPAWQALHGDLMTLTRTADYSDGLRRITVGKKTSHSKTWTPHVTLANLEGKRGGSHDGIMQALRTKMEEVSTRLKETKLPESHVTGIAMGGPVPSQVALDWDFRPTESRGRHGAQTFDTRNEED